MGLLVKLDAVYTAAVSGAVQTKSQEHPECADIIRALGVILLDKRSSDWLARHDPKALEQALQSLGLMP